MRRRVANAGFSILEVVVALGILALALVVLVESQATAVVMTVEAERIMVATMLAEQKMSEVVLLLESEGFQEADVNEEGDFSKGVFGEFLPGAMDGKFGDINEDAFEDYHWAFTIRQIDLSLAGDMGQMADDLQGSGLGPPTSDTTPQVTDQRTDMTDMGISPDMIADYLNPYIREVRVLVWWGDNEEELDQIEIVTHVVNPSGQLVSSDEEEG